MIYISRCFRFHTSTSGKSAMFYCRDYVTAVDVSDPFGLNIVEFAIDASHISIITVRLYIIVSAWGTGTQSIQNVSICICQDYNYSNILFVFRMWFFLFVMCVAINCSFTLYFACYCIAIEGIQLLYVLGVLEALVFCGLGWILTCTSVNVICLHRYHIIDNFLSFFSFNRSYMLVWIWLPMKCSIIRDIRTWETKGANT